MIVDGINERNMCSAFKRISFVIAATFLEIDILINGILRSSFPSFPGGGGALSSYAYRGCVLKGI